MSCLECHIVEIVQYTAFVDWPLSLSSMPLGSSLFQWLDSSFLFSTEQYSIVWLDSSLSTPTEGHLGGYGDCCRQHPCAASCVDRVFNSFEETARSRIAGTYCKSMFSLVRSCPTLSQTVYTLFHARQQWTRVPVAPHPYQHLVLSVLCIWHILIVFWPFPGMWEHVMRNIFSYVDLTSVYLWWNVCCCLCPIFLIRLFSYCWVVKVLCIFQITVLYQMCLLQTFSPCMGLVFSFSWNYLSSSEFKFF